MKKHAIDLAYALTLPPEKAVAYFRRKGRRVSFDWHSMWKEAHATAFTVANCAKLDVLRDLQMGIRKMLKEGKSEQWFVRTLEPVLRAKGWWGPRDEVNPRTGEVITVQQGSQWRLGLIARQNVQSAVNAGAWEDQWDNREEEPYLRYVSMEDARTRPQHRALHGKIFPIDDPFWQTHYPPNGWNCRCNVEGVSPARLKRRKWKVESSEGKMTTREIIIRDRRTGEETVRTVTGYRYDKDDIFWTDAGFDYNPGAVALADNILRERIRGLNDPALYEQARQAINNSTARHEGFAAVVEGWQKDKVIRKRAAVLGLMRWQELLHARAQGADASGVVVFADDRLHHAGRGVHQAKGTAVPDAIYPQLAALFSRPEAVYWDEAHENLLYLFPDPEDGWCRIMPVNVPGTDKKKQKKLGRHDGVASFYRLERSNLHRGRKLQKIR